MKKMFTITPKESDDMEDGRKARKAKLEPDKAVLMFISQFSKVYHVEKSSRENGYSFSMILN